MNKHKHILMVVLFGLILMPLVSKANISTAGTVNVNADVKAQLDNRDNNYNKDDRGDDKNEGDDSFKNPLRPISIGAKIETKYDMRKNILSYIVRRMEAGISRLEQITVRLESRNAKLTSAGINTSVSAGFIAQSKTEIAGAKADLALIAKMFIEVKEEPTPVATGQAVGAATLSIMEKNRTTLVSIRATFKSAKNHLENARQFLVKAVNATKAVTPVINTEVKTQTTAALNQKIFNSGIYITPLQVMTDSRCAEDVTCVWAGEVSLKVLLQKGDMSQTVVLKNNSTSVTFGGNSIELLNVAPAKNSKTSFASADYRFTFRVLPNTP